MNPIKQRIRQLRKREGLTMLEFSKRIHVSSGNVGDWESETRSSVPGANTLVAIAEAFHVSMDWLLLGILPEEQQDKYVGSEQLTVNGHLINLEQMMVGTRNEVYRELMEISLTLSQADLSILLGMALRMNGEPNPMVTNSVGEVIEPIN